ncbi:hypothetical protein GCM10022215_34990 [Nocardioides fonticola]|uniref:DUF4267 domain-containing protein n=1 Tax=Nocardioides fonticola TaxID=450363 RepID=A0ABP7XV26_9ACTN
MNPVTGLSLARIGIGALALARPDTAAQAFGLDPASNPQATYVTRLFGSREIALGTITLLSRGKARPGIVLLGVGVDAADVATGYLGPKEGQVSTKAGATLVGPAILAVLMGLAGLRPAKSREKKAAAKAAAKSERKLEKKAAKKLAKAA